MKKLIALILVLLVALALSAPLFATAETAADSPTPDTPVVSMDTDAPVVVTATTEAQEAEPGRIDLTQLLQALVGVMAVVVTRYVIPWLKAHTSAEKLAKIDYWYRVAVAAAEKAYGAGHGAEKLADATAYLKSKGIIIDDKIVDALIKELFDSAKQPA